MGFFSFLKGKGNEPEQTNAPLRKDTERDSGN